MTLRPLERPLSSTVWELRRCWATRREVSLALDRRASLPRVRGRVEHVAASGVYVLVADYEAKAKGGPMNVPTALILSVRSPHFHEPADAEPAREPIILGGVQLSLLAEEEL